MKSLWGQGNQYLRVKRSNIELSPRFAKLIILGIIILVVITFVISDVGLWNLWRAQTRIGTLESEIERLRAETAYLRTAVKELKTNPFMIEKIARERYGYLRPGDRVYRIIELPLDQKNSKTSPSSLDFRGASQ